MAKQNVKINRIVEVESSFIDRLLYSTRDRVLVVEFNSGNQAAYKDVGSLTFSSLIVSESVGETYNARIKNSRFVKTVPVEDLNLGYFEEPVSTVEEEFPVGTAVRVNFRGAQITYHGVKEGTIGLVSGYLNATNDLEVTFIKDDGNTINQWLKPDEVEKV